MRSVNQIGAEQIVIDPFDETNLNPNSYNLTLHNELMTYEEVVLDMRRPTACGGSTIPPEGLRAEPATSSTWRRTVERTETLQPRAA